MFFLKKLRVRAFYDADGGNGGGAGDTAGGGAAVGDQPPAGGGNPNPNPADQKDPAGKQPADPASQLRYQISRERDLRIAAEKKLQETLDKSKQPKPTFDADNDPDGTKQQEYLAEQKANEIFEKRMKDLGLEDTLQKIQYEKEQQEFFNIVNTEAEKFKAMGIEAPTKEQFQKTLTTIDEKGLTPEQIILLTQSEAILQRLKPGGFTPGTGTKPTTTVPKTQQEIREEIYKRDGAFGR